MPTAHSSDPSALHLFKTTKEFFVGIDSDGCVFNSMEVKHNDCFSVAFVRVFELAEISRQVHEVWDFVNLYSQTRGCNRFMAIALVCDRLREHPRVQRANLDIPDLKHIKTWASNESKLGNKSLAQEVESATGARKQELARVLAWSLLVNELVDVTVKRLPPFSQVTACLSRFAESADTVVVSSTPVDVLEREWAHHQLDQYVALIAGQEMGAKTELLRVTTQGRYQPHRVMMIGDAPGDLKAARSVGAVFYPIIPGSEEESWERLSDEASDKFFSEQYRGSYEEALIQDFMASLPEEPPWEVL